jgi:hypothetical protein
MIYEVCQEIDGVLYVETRRTSRSVAQDDCEILRWLKGGRWYVREVKA